MATIFVICFYLVSLWTIISAYNILVVFPLPGTSHSILGNAFVNTLLDAGHEVTYITPIPWKNAPANLRQIDVSKNFEAMDFGDVLNIEKLMNKEIDLFDLSESFKMMYTLANSSLMNENVQKFLHDPKEKFDAVILEWMYNELYAGFAAAFQCPLIWSSSMDPHYLVLSLIDEDTHPAYSADVYTTITPPYDFYQRASKLWSYFLARYKKWVSNKIEQEIYEQAFSSALKLRGRELPEYNEIKYSGSLMFGNSHVSAGEAIRLPQNYIPIAGYHIDPEDQPLPQDLQKIFDGAKHGVIYFSMGSMLKSKHIPEYMKKGILDIFAGLKQTVVWKFEEQLEGKPDNVHIVKWAPQRSILAHQNCVLFITHGGLLSMIETLHYGVPILGIPMFADQYNNVNRAAKKGFGERVDLDTHFLPNFEKAVHDILSNPRYRERVKELSFVYRHRPVSPRDEIKHWVEHVVRTRGATHLRSPALHVPLYQKLYLDLAAVVLIIVLLIKFAVNKCINSSSSSKKSKKLSTKKKNL